MPYNKNVPEVPTIDYKATISQIEKKVCRLEDDEREQVKELLLYHGCEPSAAAERISELLGVSYSAIFDLL